MKTIAISDETHEILKLYFCEYGDTFDIVLNRLLKKVGAKK